jgi:hypothetical protein
MLYATIIRRFWTLVKSIIFTRNFKWISIISDKPVGSEYLHWYEAISMILTGAKSIIEKSLRVFDFAHHIYFVERSKCVDPLQ